MARILSVDDDLGLLAVLEATFEDAGHEPITADDPQLAFELARTGRFDAMTIDAKMPRMSGWELLEKLRGEAATRAIPIVMLTSLNEVPDRVRGLRAGADDFLTKPFQAEELLARVEGLIDRRRAIENAARAQEASSPTLGVVSGLEEAVAELEKRFRASESLEGIELGRYVVSRLLGRGGMARVYQGWDPKLQRPVALKTIRLDVAPSRLEDLTAHLRQEAVANARINHPHIVTVYDYGDEGSAVFFAMELVDGLTLADRLEQGALSWEEVVPLAAAVAGALDAAHRRDLLHRDIKPANILLGREDTVKVSDFGISAWISRTTPTRKVAGTPGYLAPECLSGERGNGSADLFGLGALLYECLTGEHPFAADSWGKMVLRTVQETPPLLISRVPGIPPAVAEMIHRLLAKRPSDRPVDSGSVAMFFRGLSIEHHLAWRFDSEPATD